jgi:hypothetical protein
MLSDITMIHPQWDPLKKKLNHWDRLNSRKLYLANNLSLLETSLQVRVFMETLQNRVMILSNRDKKFRIILSTNQWIRKLHLIQCQAKKLQQSLWRLINNSTERILSKATYHLLKIPLSMLILTQTIIII